MIIARARHDAFSLLEVVLALAILGGSLAVLSSIALIGSDSAVRARDMTTARLICESKMSELLLAYNVAPQPIAPSPAENPDSGSMGEYLYAVEVQPAPIDGLLAVRVTVTTVAETNGVPNASFSLVRWMVDPALGLAELEAEEKALAEEAAATGEEAAATGEEELP